MTKFRTYLAAATVLLTLTTPSFAGVVCEDGVIQGDEECDDNNVLDGDCCSSTCTFESVNSFCPDVDGKGIGRICATSNSRPPASPSVGKIHSLGHAPRFRFRPVGPLPAGLARIFDSAKLDDIATARGAKALDLARKKADELLAAVQGGKSLAVVAAESQLEVKRR